MSRTGTASEAIAARVLEILDERGESVNSLAARSGIPRPTLDRHLKVTPRALALGEIEDVAGALGLTFDELFYAAIRVAA